MRFQDDFQLSSTEEEIRILELLSMSYRTLQEILSGIHPDSENPTKVGPLVTAIEAFRKWASFLDANVALSM